MAKKLNSKDVQLWSREAADEILKNFKQRTGGLPLTECEAYHQGIRRGFKAAVAELQLRGFLEVE